MPVFYGRAVPLAMQNERDFYHGLLSPERLPANADGEPLSVEAALLTLSPRTDQVLSISGRIVSVETKYANSNYAKLAGYDATISVKLPKNPVPQVGDQITIRGVFSVQPSRFPTGLEVQLIGQILGAVPITGPLEPPIELIRKREPQRLSRMVGRVLEKSQSDPRVAAICTEVGFQDAYAACARYDAKIEWNVVQPSFSDREGILRSIHSLIGESLDGLVVMRGGGAAGSLDLWNDPEVVAALLELDLPFYTALGHSTDLVVADRYADESFESPSTFGATLGQIVNEWRQKQDLRKAEAERALQFEAGQKRLEESIAKLQQSHLEQQQQMRQAHEAQLKQMEARGDEAVRRARDDAERAAREAAERLKHEQEVRLRTAVLAAKSSTRNRYLALTVLVAILLYLLFGGAGF